MKSKLSYLILIGSFFFFQPLFAQSADLSITLSVAQSDTEVKVLIKNTSTIKPYKTMVAITDATGYQQLKTGVVNPNGDQITVTLDGLQKKAAYSVGVAGLPIPLDGTSFGPKSYALKTDHIKPGIVETTGTTPPIIPDPNNPPTGGSQGGGDTSSGGSGQGTVTGQGSGTTQQQGGNTSTTANTTGLTQSQIAADKIGSGLVPCVDTCDFNDVLRLINNLITFLITTIFIPIVILLFMYAGYRYLTAGGNPAKIVNIKKMVRNIIVGMLLVLCSWLIVKTIVTVVVKDQDGALQFLE